MTTFLSFVPACGVVVTFVVAFTKKSTPHVAHYPTTYYGDKS